MDGGFFGFSSSLCLYWQRNHHPPSYLLTTPGTLPYNFVNNYKFGGPMWSDSWLKGFSVGAGLRWQDKIAIGNPLKVVNGATVPDFDQKYFGPSDTNVDTWITYDRKVRNNLVIS